MSLFWWTKLQARFLIRFF